MPYLQTPQVPEPLAQYPHELQFLHALHAAEPVHVAHVRGLSLSDLSRVPDLRGPAAKPCTVIRATVSRIIVAFMAGSVSESTTGEQAFNVALSFSPYFRRGQFRQPVFARNGKMVGKIRTEQLGWARETEVFGGK